MAKDLNTQRNHMRERIAQQAARLIAEDGMQDYISAKRKAARQLGAPDTHNLPNNREVEQAVRAYHNIYQQHEHAERLRLLRQQAIASMQLLRDFNPHLTGSALNGTASRHSNINLQLFADNVKEVELFLLNQKIPYKSGERRIRIGDTLRLLPTFTFCRDEINMDITVFATNDLRNIARNSIDGTLLERANLQQLQALL